MRLPITIILLLFIHNLATAEIATGKAKKNALYNHPSPYLAMHGRDPVRWHEWNAKTVALARKQKKLLFVSSGYFSCHWCHVMQRESYQNNEIAMLLNKYFLPVKVDRELNSALDAKLIEFVQRTQGISGWPLNVFVTPDGYPLVGMVYVPTENLREILLKLNEEWNRNSAELVKLARAASEELAPATAVSSHMLPEDLDALLMQSLTTQIASNADDLQGGFGQENKFPSVPQLDALLDIYARQPHKDVRKFLTLTLQQMASQGLRDQLAGGFYRYVVDPGWHIPHFEKMLYDNALLASLYYKAGSVLKEPAYTAVADDTLAFMLRELDTGSGALAASLSAVDDRGIEGGYYLWDETELRKILSPDEWQVVSLFWQLQGPPDLEDGHHLVQSGNIEQVAKQLAMEQRRVNTLLDSARGKMIRLRNQRVLPKDDKLLTAWNGLALSALVAGSRQDEKHRFRQAATELAGFIQTRFWDGRQLHRAISANGSLGKGNLEDYAYTIQGLYDWWQLSKTADTRRVLQELIEQAWRRFYGMHGWQLAEDMLLRFGQGRPVIEDGVLPSPSAVLINVSYNYALDTDNEALRKQALRALNTHHTEISNDAFWFASQIRAILSLNRAAVK